LGQLGQLDHLVQVVPLDHLVQVVLVVQVGPLVPLEQAGHLDHLVQVVPLDQVVPLALADPLVLVLILLRIMESKEF
jgi:hypothetical protein